MSGNAKFEWFLLTPITLSFLPASTTPETLKKNSSLEKSTQVDMGTRNE